MSAEALLRSPAVIRWLVFLVILVVSSLLVEAILHSSTASLSIIHNLVLILTALAVYSWVLDSAIWSVVFSVIVLGMALWAWGTRQASILGWDVGVFGVLLVVAAIDRQRRLRRARRLRQVLDDVDEELTVKGQAIALANQTREALQKKLSRYQQLQTIAETLSNMTDLSEIAQLAVDRAFTLIGKSDACLLFLVDKEQQELSLFASRKRDTTVTIRAKHGDQFDRYVLRSHRPLLVNDVRRDFRFTVNVAQERPIGSVIACPLLMDQNPEGLLRLDSPQPAAYTQDDLRFLDILLDLVATAMTNARLFAQVQRLAMTDGLTGLTLRRPFLEQLTRELLRAGRGREPASVLMLDVDHFKMYNDTFGHMAGDLVLKAVAEVLRTVVPPGGVSARYGGEEFAVLLPKATRHHAGDVAEQIRRTVEQEVQGAGAGKNPRANPQRVTISIGVASFPDDGKSELELIRVADQRLYQAKRAGRNLVCLS